MSSFSTYCHTCNKAVTIVRSSLTDALRAKCGDCGSDLVIGNAATAARLVKFRQTHDDINRSDGRPFVFGHDRQKKFDDLMAVAFGDHDGLKGYEEL